LNRKRDRRKGTTEVEKAEGKGDGEGRKMRKKEE
jgi:hypothetical protein